VKSYVITIPNVLKDLQALQMMKDHAARIARDSNNGEVIEGYIRIIFSILGEKLKAKGRKVLIIDLGNESPARLWPVKDFCIRSHAEVMEAFLSERKISRYEE
jgi:hypothetical protein